MYCIICCAVILRNMGCKETKSNKKNAGSDRNNKETCNKSQINKYAEETFMIDFTHLTVNGI